MIATPPHFSLAPRSGERAGVRGALLACVLLATVTQTAASEALLLSGAKVYTLDATRPWADAVVIRDGRIAYVGDEPGARKEAGADARVVALEGRMVLPGFHDSHTHPMSGAMRLLRCRLGDLPGAREVYAEIGRCAAAKAKGAWVLGAGWRPGQFGPDGPTRAKLDELLPDNPAFLTTEDGYTGWANTKALQASGLADKRKKSRRASGVVDDDDAARIRRAIPTPNAAEYREALRRATAMANRVGITSVVDAAASPAMLDAYRAADDAGELTVRVVAAQRVDPKLGPEQVDAMVARRARTCGDQACGKRFRADAAKIFLDGEIDRHTAAMLAPYADAPDARGSTLLDPDALDAIVRRLDAEGFAIHVHVMGDGAVRAALDAIERAIAANDAAANGARDRRHQLAHVGVADPADIPRFATLGVAADFSPIWAQAGDPSNGPMQKALGPERARHMFPIGAVAKAGGRILGSSDWPQPSMNPLEGIQYAVTRQPLDAGAPPVQPEQRADLATMLAAYTREGAWAAREEAIDGTIAVGKAADLVVLDRNLFEREPARLHEARVLLTLLDGDPVFRDAAIAWPGAETP